MQLSLTLLITAASVVAFFAIGSLWTIVLYFRTGSAALDGRAVPHSDRPTLFWCIQLGWMMFCVWMWIALLILILMLVGVLPRTITA